MSIKFSKEHEWINAADTNAAIVGITVHAQDALGDVVFVDLLPWAPPSRPAMWLAWSSPSRRQPTSICP